MKLGIDLCSFRRVHCGGKDEVAYNLLHGFEMLGHSKDIVCFCYPELVEHIREISPEAQISIIQPSKEPRFMRYLLRYATSWQNGAKVKKQLKSHPVDTLLFTNKESPLMCFPVKTYVITHDVKLFRKVQLEGNIKLQIYNWFDRIFIKREFKMRDGIFSISEFDKSEICHFMPEIAHKVKRIYNPIRFVGQADMDTPKKYITALNIQWNHKNVKTLLLAYEKIANQIPWNLILVGRKPENYGELETIVQKSNLGERITFTGFVSEEQLQQIIRQTRLYVNPSLFEGFGMTAVEMMGWCIPTIVANNTAQPEVTQGLCRYYHPTESADALAKAMLEEFENPADESCLKEISDTIQKCYDYVNIAREYWEYIENNL